MMADRVALHSTGVNRENAPDCIREALADPNLGATLIQLPADTAVHEPDDPAENFYAIDSGQVRIYQVGADKSCRLASILGPRDWFGLTGLDPGTRYGTRAATVTATALWRISTASLARRTALLPPLESQLIVYLSKALREAQEEAARLVFDDCNSRLLKTLVHFSGSAAATPADGGVVLRITHEQLAQAVGAARETISLALTQLRHQNLLRTGRNRLIFNPEALREFAARTQPARAEQVEQESGKAQ